MAEPVVHSPLEVVNLALDAIGVTSEANNLDSPTERWEIVAARQYPQVKRLLFEEADWPFASKEAAIAGIDTWESQQWAKAYSLPEDFIRARELLPSSSDQLVGVRPSEAGPVIALPYDFAQHDGVRVLVTDVDGPVLRYTADIEVRQWPAMFTEAMVWRLAARVAGPLKASADLSGHAMKMAVHATAVAIAQARNEVQAYPRRNSVLTRRR